MNSAINSQSAANLSPAAPASSRDDLHGDSRTRLHGRWLALARLAWLAVVALCVGVFVIAIPLRYDELASLSAPFVGNPAAERANLVHLGLTPGTFALYYLLGEIIFALGCCTVAAIIFARKSNDWMGLLISFTLVGLGTTFPETIRALELQSELGDRLVKLLNVLSIGSFMVTFHLFPDGHFAFRWSKWPILIWVPLLVSIVFFPGSLEEQNSLSSLALFPLVLVMLVLVIFTQFYRYWRISGPVQREQTRWVVFGVSVALTGLAATVVPPEIFPVLRLSSLLSRLIVNTVRLFFMLLIPLSIGIAILRHRLYDIDLLINRTLVFIPLTAILAGIFASSITLSQKLFVAITGATSDAATVMTTLIVVAAFDPIKNGLQHLVDRRFKEGPDPTKTLKAFDQQVQSFIQMIDRKAITRRLLDEASHAFDAENGALFLARDGQLALVQSCGEWSGEAKINVPLQSSESGTQIGLVALGPRRNGLDYTLQDRETLQQIAMHVTRVIALMGDRDGVRH